MDKRRRPSRGQVEQSEVHRAQPRAAGADRIRRRDLRVREEDPVAVRRRRHVRSVGQAGRGAARGRRPQDAGNRRRQFRRPHEIDQAARRLHGAEHADRRGQRRGRHHLREHGRFLARRGRQEGRQPGQAARGPDAAFQPADLHGRQERRRSPDHQGRCRTRRCCRRWRQPAPAAPSAPPAARRNKPCPQPNRTRPKPAAATTSAESEFAVAAEPRVQAEERQGARGGADRRSRRWRSRRWPTRRWSPTTRCARSRR